MTGGGGAHPYAVARQAGDPHARGKMNYHYLQVAAQASKMTITMNRLEMKDGKPNWTQPDQKEIEVRGDVAEEQ